MKRFDMVGMVLVGALGLYLLSMNRQVSDVTEACERYAAGAAIGDVASLEDEFSLQVMGPFAADDVPDTQELILCASMTMCDTSCRIQFRDGRVTNSWKRDL